jgi:hypothetical protein
VLEVTELQPAGGLPMSAESFVRGHPRLIRARLV